MPELGVCYYPEHWPEGMWRDDAARMVASGITWVRIGEFAWSRMEPKPGVWDLEWLDRGIDILGSAGLKVVLGTPTATPPRWLEDNMPDMLPVAADGTPRIFGSRRHYCFSHLGYRDECRRIVDVLARRYGASPHVQAWQIDNEYACHDTALSYSDAARSGFRDWLAQRYQSIDALNRAWGNVFWSMEYDDFGQIDLPNQTVTEANPSHVLAFRRYTSDQVVAFNKVQVDALRPHTDAPLIHNYMGRITDFDHWDIGRDLDIASWDSYPLGFLLDRVPTTPDQKTAFSHQGHPDFQAFHHDLYRAVGKEGWWVMEQQPGPVNWAPWNPAPLPGMVRLWSMEAFAHGADVVSYFRWRQAPFAQEQMHAGLNRPDNAPSPVMEEISKLTGELDLFKGPVDAPAPVGLVFDYASQWAWETQPQGADFDYFALVFDTYRALRRAGLSIDILSPDTTDLSSYDLVLVPGLLSLNDTLQDALKTVRGRVVLGPRCNTKTPQLTIPNPLPPDIEDLSALIAWTETLAPGSEIPVQGGGVVQKFLETVETQASVQMKSISGTPVLIESDKIQYLTGWPDDALWDRLVGTWAAACGLDIVELPEGLRLRRHGTREFAFNYGASPVKWQDQTLQPAGVAWRDLPG